MTANNNTDVSRKIRDGLKINQATDEVPTKVANSIVPVFVSNPDRQIMVGTGSVATDSTSATIMTTSSIKDTYLIGAMISVSKDVVSDSTNSSLIFTPYGLGATSGLHIRYEPLTAGEHQQVVNFNIPIKLTRNTTITVTNSTATASIDTAGRVFYFEI